VPEDFADKEEARHFAGSRRALGEAAPVARDGRFRGIGRVDCDARDVARAGDYRQYTRRTTPLCLSYSASRCETSA